MILREDIEANIDCDKAWYDANRKILFPLPPGFHHCWWLVDNPEECNFEKNYGLSVESYINQFERHHAIVPKFDEGLLEKFIENGWVRLYFDYENEPFFGADTYTVRNAAMAMKSFLRYVLPKHNYLLDEVSRLEMDIHETKTTEKLMGKRFSSFLKTGSIPSKLMAEMNQFSYSLRRIVENMINE